MSDLPPPERDAALYRDISYWRDFLLILAILSAGLVIGSDILISFVTAVLLFVLFTAITDWIETYGLPRWLAHVLALAIVLTGLAGVVSILIGQAEEVAIALPRYQTRVALIVEQVTALLGAENAARIAGMLEDADFAGVALSVFGGARAFLAGLFLVLLYIPFLMVERRPMTQKLAIATQDPALDQRILGMCQEIAEKLQRYVGVKTFVSALTGLFSYAVMKPLGLDFAETWAVLAFALNFIPSIGSILGVILPSFVALVQFDTLAPFLMIAVGCGIVQFLIGNVLEPSLMGRSLNISPLMVILALTFWTAIWGITGAFLSVPITVFIMITLSHFPSLRPIAVLMSMDGNLKSEQETMADAQSN